MKKPEQPVPSSLISSRRVAWRSILSFVVFIALAAGGVYAYKWVKHQPKQDRALKPLRKALSFNEAIFGKVFDSGKLVKEYPVSAAVKNVRVNGYEGIRDTVDINTWRMKVVRNTGDTMVLTLDEIKKLPKKEVVFDFKCIEGWSQVTRWAGVPLKTFMDHYHLQPQEQLQYIGLQTPDKKYYVGIDMPSALQAQTLLCYEMNGEPLPMNQGYPLRLIIPVKYGIKHLKRIGTLFFSNEKPPDFWAERGYDYYAGH